MKFASETEFKKEIKNIPASRLASAIITNFVNGEEYNPLTFHRSYNGSRSNQEYMESLLSVEVNPICKIVCEKYIFKNSFWSGYYSFAALAQHIINKTKFKSISSDKVESYCYAKGIKHYDRYSRFSAATNHFCNTSFPYPSKKLDKVFKELKFGEFEKFSNEVFFKITGEIKPDRDLTYNFRKKVDVEIIDESEIYQFNTKIVEDDISEIYEILLFEEIK